MKEHFVLLLTFQSQVEASKPVTRKTVSSTLQDYSTGLISFHDFRHNRIKYLFVALIVDAISKWKIDGVVFSFACTNILKRIDNSIVDCDS